MVALHVADRYRLVLGCGERRLGDLGSEGKPAPRRGRLERGFRGI
jgi:hypothetical protein